MECAGARDLHRVACLGPLQRIGRWEAFATPAQARDAYLRTVREDPGAPPLTSGVWRVRLVLGGRPAAERYVVRSLPRLT